MVRFAFAALFLLERSFHPHLGRASKVTAALERQAPPAGKQTRARPAVYRNRCGTLATSRAKPGVSAAPASFRRYCLGSRRPRALIAPWHASRHGPTCVSLMLRTTSISPVSGWRSTTRRTEHEGVSAFPVQHNSSMRSMCCVLLRLFPCSAAPGALDPECDFLPPSCRYGASSFSFASVVPDVMLDGNRRRWGKWSSMTRWFCHCPPSKLHGLCRQVTSASFRSSLWRFAVAWDSLGCAGV